MDLGGIRALSPTSRRICSKNKNFSYNGAKLRTAITCPQVQFN